MLIEETLISIISFCTNFARIPVFPQKIPEGQNLPAIAYTRVDSVPVRSLGGYSGLSATRFQFDCWATSYATAKQNSLNLIKLLSPYRKSPIQAIFLQNESDKYVPPIKSDDTGFFASSIDFIVWHNT